MEKATVQDGMVQGFKCVECDDTFYSIPEWGYCDNTLDCTDPDTLVPFTWVADDFDYRHAVQVNTSPRATGGYFFVHLSLDLTKSKNWAGPLWITCV